jgi:hypothetical protein
MFGRSEMRMQPRRLSLGLALAVAIGCSGGAGGGSSTGGMGGTGGTGKGSAGGSSGSIAPADFGQAFEAAYCAPLVSCGVYPDLANCEAATLFAESNFVLTAIGDVGRGISRYDAAAAAACIAALPTTCIATQDSFQPTLLSEAPLNVFLVTAACANIFTGTLAQGATCQGSFECGASAPDCSPIDQTTCSLTTCCPGTCQPYVNIDPAELMPHALGDECTDNNLCQLPAVCTGTCTVPPAHGAPCASSGSYPCQRLDDFCEVSATDATTPTCTSRLAVGADCSSTEFVLAAGCPLDGRCVGDASGSSSCTVWQTLGGSCRFATDCVAGLTCSAAGVCAPVPTGMDCGAS